MSDNTLITPTGAETREGDTIVKVSHYDVSTDRWQSMPLQAECGGCGAIYMYGIGRLCGCKITKAEAFADAN